MLQKIDDVIVQDVHPDRRSLIIIAQRRNIAQQDIPSYTSTIPDIMHILRIYLTPSICISIIIRIVYMVMHKTYLKIPLNHEL